jgi:hypothetical protein
VDENEEQVPARWVAQESERSFNSSTHDSYDRCMERWREEEDSSSRGGHCESRAGCSGIDEMTRRSAPTDDAKVPPRKKSPSWFAALVDAVTEAAGCTPHSHSKRTWQSVPTTVAATL